MMYRPGGVGGGERMMYGWGVGIPFGSMRHFFLGGGMVYRKMFKNRLPLSAEPTLHQGMGRILLRHLAVSLLGVRSTTSCSSGRASGPDSWLKDPQPPCPGGGGVITPTPLRKLSPRGKLSPNGSCQGACPTEVVTSRGGGGQLPSLRKLCSFQCRLVGGMGYHWYQLQYLSSVRDMKFEGNIEK